MPYKLPIYYNWLNCPDQNYNTNWYAVYFLFYICEDHKDLIYLHRGKDEG